MRCISFLFLVIPVFCYANKAVSELDLEKYVGKWYEVYQNNFDKVFQGNGKCAFANYGLMENGKVSVLNSQLLNGKTDSIAGYAYYKDNDCCGYLTVNLNNIPEAPYWVLELGPIVDDLYDYSIVSDDKNLSLFVLTRDVDRFYKLYNDDILNSLETLGFTKAFNKPLTMNQTNCELF